MFERVIDWSIENRFLIVVAAILITAAGAYSLWRAPLDAIPDLSDVQVIVYTEYPGQAPRRNCPREFVVACPNLSYRYFLASSFINACPRLLH